MARVRRRIHPIFLEDDTALFSGPSPRRRWWVLLPLCLVLVVVVVQRAQAGYHSLGAGELRLHGEGEVGAVPALQQSTEVDIAVAGMIADVTVTQHFKNHTEMWREGVYQFPLPEQAAVSGMRLRIGERVIEGEVQERSQAMVNYQKAKMAGKRASLLSQQRPNLFTTAVANIAPGETVTVELQYFETVAYDSGRFSLRLPMTITPRYIPGAVIDQPAQVESWQQGWGLATDQVSDAPTVTPWLQQPGQTVNRARIRVKLDAGLPLADIESPYHKIVTEQLGSRYHLNLAQGTTVMDRDFVLHWWPTPSSQPKAAWFSQQQGDEYFAMVMVMPPQQAPQALPREVIFVLDTSGSMGGEAIRQAKHSLRFALAQLSPADRFNVITFNNKAQSLFTQPVVASAQHISRAETWVASLEASGGTEMMTALTLALPTAVDELVSADPQRLRQVVFITDGAVANEQALFDTINQRLGTSRLFTVGIGSAPNSHFMRRAARYGRGSFAHIGKLEDVDQQMSALLSKIASPIAADLNLQWQGDAVLSPAIIPDLYLGEPLLITAKVAAPNSALTVAADTQQGHWQQHFQRGTASPARGIDKLWARYQIDDRLDRRASLTDAQRRSDVLALALKYQLLSPYTRFIAVDKTPARSQHDALQSRNVANTPPAGQTPQRYAMPATAQGVAQRWLWSGILLSVALLLVLVIKQEQRHGLLP